VGKLRAEIGIETYAREKKAASINGVAGAGYRGRRHAAATRVRVA
jgi:hypothetical protein